jgi:hypothetical protein
LPLLCPPFWLSSIEGGRLAVAFLVVIPERDLLLPLSLFLPLPSLSLAPQKPVILSEVAHGTS